MPSNFSANPQDLRREPAGLLREPARFSANPQASPRGPRAPGATYQRPSWPPWGASWVPGGAYKRPRRPPPAVFGFSFLTTSRAAATNGGSRGGRAAREGAWWDLPGARRPPGKSRSCTGVYTLVGTKVRKPPRGACGFSQPKRKAAVFVRTRV